MIRPDLVKRYERILSKWKNYKRLRTQYPEKCVVGTPHFLDWRAREQMFEDLLNIIEYSQDD